MALVLATLGLYLYLVEFPAKQSQEQQESAKKKVVNVEEQAITSLTFKSDREELVFGMVKVFAAGQSAPVLATGGGGLR